MAADLVNLFFFAVKWKCCYLKNKLAKNLFTDLVNALEERWISRWFCNLRTLFLEMPLNESAVKWKETVYSEISNFNPQTEYFHKKVNIRLFKKCCFWGCDVENWVWTKLALWICPILWIRVKIGYTQLSLTFFHYYRPIRPIYQKIKKIIFPKKNHDFWIKNVL